MKRGLKICLFLGLIILISLFFIGSVDATELKIGLIQSDWSANIPSASGLEQFAWMHNTSFVFWESMFGMDLYILNDSDVQGKTDSQLNNTFSQYDVIIVDSLIREPSQNFSTVLANYTKDGGIVILTGTRNLGYTYAGDYNFERLPIPLETALGIDVIMGGGTPDVVDGIYVSNTTYILNHSRSILFSPTWKINQHQINISSVGENTSILAKYYDDSTILEHGSIAEAHYGEGYILNSIPSLWQNWHDISTFYKRGAETDMVVYKSIILGFLKEKLNAQNKPFATIHILPYAKKGLFSLRSDNDLAFTSQDVIDYGNKLKNWKIRGTSYSIAINQDYSTNVTQAGIDQMKILDAEGFDIQFHDQGMHNLTDETNTILNSTGDVVIAYTFDKYKGQVREQLEWLNSSTRLNKTIRIKVRHGGSGGNAPSGYDDYYKAGQDLGIELDAKAANPAFPVKLQYNDTKLISTMYSWGQATSDRRIDESLSGGETNDVEGLDRFKNLSNYYYDNSALFMVNIHTQNLIPNIHANYDMSSMLGNFTEWYKEKEDVAIWTQEQILDYWKNRDKVKIINITYVNENIFNITLNNTGNETAYGITLTTRNNISSANISGVELQNINDNKVGLPPISSGETITVEFLTTTTSVTHVLDVDYKTNIINPKKDNLILQSAIYGLYPRGTIPSKTTFKTYDNTTMMIITPSTSSINVIISNFSSSYVEFNMSNNSAVITANIEIGNLTSNTYYTTYRDNSPTERIQANTSGFISFSNSVWSEHTFIIEPSKSNGESCSSDLECLSGQCNNGVCGDSISEEETPSGGGSPTYKPTQEQLEEGYEKSLGKNWKIEFEFENETRTIKVDKIINKTATLTVSSVPITFNLTVNETKKLNLNNDEFYDLQIFLKNITDYRANLVVKSIHEEIPAELLEKEKEKIIEGFQLWLIVGFIVIVTVIVLIIRKKK